MKLGLKWLAENHSKWPAGHQGWLAVNYDYDDDTFYWGSMYFPGDDSLHIDIREWKEARIELGLEKPEVVDAEEEEWIRIAKSRMNEDSVKVSIEELQDNVNKPKHYQLREGYEVYDLRQDLAAKAANGGATYDQHSDWDRAIEYIIRMWGKNRLEDAKKGRWYLDKLIEKLEAQE